MAFRFPSDEPVREEDAAIVEASRRGLARVIERLRIAEPSSITVYVHTDEQSKSTLTGKPGDGHAVPAAGALHVRRFDASPAGPLERLVAHEGTHLLGRTAWGPPGSALLGEGLAVWVSGGYGGVDLEQWRARATRHPIEPLLGMGFFRVSEAESYPLAGLLVEAAVKEVGLDGVREHLLPATWKTWDEACRAAGATPEALAQAVGESE